MSNEPGDQDAAAGEGAGEGSEPQQEADGAGGGGAAEVDDDRPSMTERLNLMGVADPPVWRRRWFQLLLAVLIVGLTLQMVLPPVFSLIYAARPVVGALVLGLTLAYVFNPLITYLERERNVPRPASAAGLMVVSGLVVVGLLVWLVPALISQVVRLVQATPAYIAAFLEWAQVDVEEAKASATQAANDLDLQSIDYGAVSSALLSALNTGVGALAGVLGWITAVGLMVVVAAICFFVFVWKLGPIRDWTKQFIPASHRDEVLRLLMKMDQSVSAYIRGRLIQGFILAVILSVGWGIADVPYFLLLGLAGGVLGLLPYLAVVTWPLAILLAWIEATTGGTGFSFWMVLFWPTVVYMVAQLVDGWAVEPIVQGQATDLDPLTVLLVVLAGGAIAGLLGLILAVPAAACGKILLRDVVLPRLREVAAEN
ncbi:MAG: AI-2E family transporter [Planctomycetota bacterium]